MSFGQQITYIPEEESTSRAVGNPQKKLCYNHLHAKYPHLLEVIVASVLGFANLSGDLQSHGKGVFSVIRIIAFANARCCESELSIKRLCREI